MEKKQKKRIKPPTIIVVSGSTGASGVQIVETVLAQFPDNTVPIIKKDYVRHKKQVEDIVSRASPYKGIIVHTLVDKSLRNLLISLAKEKKVSEIDLMGTLMEQISGSIDQKPLGKPGFYRLLHKDYFERIEAMRFSTLHDDGQRPQDLPLADIVLLGVSRCGKTPLSTYLAVLGWKVANIPFISEDFLPRELDEVEKMRIFGLSIEYERLLAYRKKREAGMKIGSTSQYTKPSEVYKELDHAKKFYRKKGFTIIDITNKAIEASADEIIEIMISRFPETEPEPEERETEKS
jgi:regulator of PEP synthase PpsR (kinase-PPPase family)